MKNEVVHVHGIHSYTETFKHKLYIKSTSVKKEPNPASAKQPFRTPFNRQQPPVGNGKVPVGATQLSSIAEVNSIGEMDMQSSIQTDRRKLLSSNQRLKTLSQRMSKDSKDFRYQLGTPQVGANDYG